MNFTDQQFAETRIRAEKFYKKIGTVFCPALSREVHFNSKGLEHLKFKKWNRGREQKDQYVRLRLLHLVPEVLKKSHTIQGLLKTRKFEYIKVNSRWEQVMGDVIYYEFISIIDGCRIRVIVKEVNDSPLHFWSIVPYWKQGPRGKKMFEGNPEED